MSSPTPATTPNPALSRASAIEYKAFARRFFPKSEAGILFLAATCYHGTPGWKVSFQQTASGFELVDQPPTGIHPDFVTYYSAGVGFNYSGQQELNIPTHVTVTDGFGTHHVSVKPF